jgi:preprotein translocase subunit SecA
MSSHPRRLARSQIERPQREPERGSALRRAAHALHGLVLRPMATRPDRFRRFVPAILAEGARLERMNDSAFAAHVLQFREHLVGHAAAPDALTSTFALVREAAGRALGMRHFESQILGGLAIYHGAIAEMRTGEGKTLTATLPAAAAALAGVPVHVLTVNDYLAERDAELMRPVYELLGLSVGCVVRQTPSEARRDEYAGDVVYCANKELVFDFMRDGLLLRDAGRPLQLHAQRLKGRRFVDESLMMRGLHFAIVDEADSVLLDEARTPLVISGSGRSNAQEETVLAQALDIARRLEEGADYTVDKLARRLELTRDGEWRILDLSEGLGSAWTGQMRRLELGRQALVALTLFDRDSHYLVRDDAVIIIDENTGRAMPDRSWEQGLHQLIELKEGVPLTHPNETLSRLSFQRFFRHYHHLGGMTGTAGEVAGELWSSYDLPVTRIPTHKPSRLENRGAQVLRTIDEKWSRVAERVSALNARGQPVLIGTHTVGASEALSEVLTRACLVHKVLNARQDRDEAEIVARAGEIGAITIATNMAGRGTDIKLGKDVEERGGLRVILTELHESGRLDRQLIGRAARQGDPGEFEIIVSLEDQILHNNAPRAARLLAAMPEGRRRTSLALALMRLQQWRAGRIFASRRAELLQSDEHEMDTLAFAGRHA